VAVPPAGADGESEDDQLHRDAAGEVRGVYGALRRMSGMGEGCGWMCSAGRSPMQNTRHSASSTLLPGPIDAMVLHPSIYNEEAPIGAHCERAMVSTIGEDV
jgi:hypothetical protein